MLKTFKHLKKQKGKVYILPYPLNNMENKILKKSCKFCSKEFTSLYSKQLEYNVKAHELSCKQKIIEDVHNALKKEGDKK